VNKRITQAGGNVADFTGREAVARGMTLGAGDVNRFYSTNENVSVTGAIKRAFSASNINAEELVGRIAGSQAGMLAEAFDMKAEDVGKLDFTQFAANFNKIRSQAQRVELIDKLAAAGTISKEERAAILSNLGTMTDKFGVASDRGAMRTARIRQVEEAERAQHGGYTSVELKAGAVVANEQLINEAFKDIGGGDIQKGLTQGLKDIREKKVQDLMKEKGVSAEEAGKTVDAEGFTIPELLRASSGVSREGMQKAVEVGLAKVNEELKKAEKTGDKGRLEQLQLQKVDLEEYKDALASGDKDRIQAAIAKAEKHLADKKYEQTQNQTPEQKKAAETQDATVNTAKDVKELLQVTRAMAEKAGITAESIRNLDKNVSGA
jgi:fructose/tagatose bisphosphate aldolase